ncbi:MAG: hypothetical protein ACSHX4_03610 [Opitutaceae bacterium]
MVAAFVATVVALLFWLVLPLFNDADEGLIYAASLVGIFVGAYVYRERALVRSLQAIEKRYLDEASEHNARLEHLYMQSLACLVEFDASTLKIERASIGFFDLLGIGSGVDLRGDNLEQVLGVEAAGLESLVGHISKGSRGLRQAIQCRRPDGKQIDLLMSAYYLEESDRIEAAFFVSNPTVDVSEDIEQISGDLERFRKGMVRREERILELKAEVNELMAAAKESPRYRVDANSDDTKYSVKLERQKKGNLIIE